MEDNHCFYNFSTMMASIPHVAEKIVSRLDAFDVANCLRVSKGFRLLISNALHWNQQLQFRLDEEVSRFAVTSLTLDPQHCCPMMTEYVEQKDFPQTGKCFGIDDTLWVFRHRSNSCPEEQCPEPNTTLTIYDLKNGTRLSSTSITKQDSLSNLGLKILPGSGVLVQSKDKLWRFTKMKCCRQYLVNCENCPMPKLKSYSYVSNGMLGDDCIIFCIKRNDDQLWWELYLWDWKIGDEELKTDCTIRLYSKPKEVRRKGCYAMVKLSNNKFTMFNATSGDVLYRMKKIPKNAYNITLTETFCSFMYRTRTVNVALLDTATGHKICNKRCWINYQGSHVGSQVRFYSTASGNYFFACATKTDYNGRVDEIDGYGHRLLCIKVDPKSKACKLRRTRSGLEIALLANTESQEMDLKKESRNCGPHENKHENQQPNCISIHNIKFFGFASESVVIGQAEFDYHSRDSFRYLRGKSVFSVDLEKLLEGYEPLSVFSAVHFPLRQNVFNTFEGTQYSHAHNKTMLGNNVKPRLFPYFKTEKQVRGGQLRLAGLVEVDDKKFKALKAKIYSFGKCLEVKELCEEEMSVPAKRIKFEQA